MTDEKKEKGQKEILVVSELPKTPTRIVTDEKGTEYELITVEEAVTRILKDVSDIKKAVA